MITSTTETATPTTNTRFQPSEFIASLKDFMADRIKDDESFSTEEDTAIMSYMDWLLADRVPGSFQEVDVEGEDKPSTTEKGAANS